MKTCTIFSQTLILTSITNLGFISTPLLSIPLTGFNFVSFIVGTLLIAGSLFLSSLIFLFLYQIAKFIADNFIK